MSWNQTINTPPQSDASDVTVDAEGRLHRKAFAEDKPWLHSVLQVHDDLEFMVPDAKMDEAIDDIVTECLGYQADWLNVPLAVEVEIGKDLASMKTIMKDVRSDEWRRSRRAVV